MSLRSLRKHPARLSPSDDSFPERYESAGRDSQISPARPRAIGWNGAGGWVMTSQDRQENFSRRCWITFHWRGTSSRVSVTSSPDVGKRGFRVHDGMSRMNMLTKVTERTAPGLAPGAGCRTAARFGAGRGLRAGEAGGRRHRDGTGGQHEISSARQAHRLPPSVDPVVNGGAQPINGVAADR
jgi:hypothetical protein